MQKMPIWRYIWFGTALRYLQDAAPGINWKSPEPHEPGHGYIMESVEGFLNELESFGLQVTSKASYELRNFLDEKKGLNHEARISLEDANKLRQMATKIRTTLEAEASIKYAFISTEKRISIDKLYNTIGDLFAPGVFDSLPEIARFDFVEAGKCIVFERATAAAFHSLRGAEAVLRHYYTCLIRRDRVPDLMWGPMVKSLRDRNRAKIPEALLKNLDNIRESFRNPTNHPDKKYDISETQDVFNLCIDVVNRMQRDLETRKQKKRA